MKISNKKNIPSNRGLNLQAQKYFEENYHKNTLSDDSILTNS